MERPALVSSLLQKVFRRSSAADSHTLHGALHALEPEMSDGLSPIGAPLSTDDLEAIVGGLELIPGSLPRQQQPQ